MRFRIPLVLAAFLGWPLTQLPARAENKPAFTNIQDKVGYAIGTQIGRNLKKSNWEVNLDEIKAGIKDVLAGRELKLGEQEAQETIGAYQSQKYREISEKNIKDGETFLAENKKKPGIKTHAVTLPDGQTGELQYKVITEGAGEMPKPTDQVTVNYRGKVLNGEEYDSSFKRGHPSTFIVNTVVHGWSEALQLMKSGSKWEVYLPPSLAYGARSMPGITPNATLVVEVELLRVETPPPPKALTSDIIRVPSAEEMKAGAKIEVIKPEDLEKMTSGQTNHPKSKN
jgi:FKBP-type peptidyl-prolyl cis-trans isomerase FklB